MSSYLKDVSFKSWSLLVCAIVFGFIAGQSLWNIIEGNWFGEIGWGYTIGFAFLLVTAVLMFLRFLGDCVYAGRPASTKSTRRLHPLAGLYAVASIMGVVLAIYQGAELVDWNQSGSDVLQWVLGVVSVYVFFAVFVPDLRTRTQSHPPAAKDAVLDLSGSLAAGPRRQAS